MFHPFDKAVHLQSWEHKRGNIRSMKHGRHVLLRPIGCISRLLSVRCKSNSTHTKSVYGRWAQTTPLPIMTDVVERKVSPIIDKVRCDHSCKGSYGSKRVMGKGVQARLRTEWSGLS